MALSPSAFSWETMSWLGFDGSYWSISPLARACTHSSGLTVLKTKVGVTPGVPHHLSFLTRVMVPFEALSILYGPELGSSLTSGMVGMSGW